MADDWRDWLLLNEPDEDEAERTRRNEWEHAQRPEDVTA